MLAATEQARYSHKVYASSSTTPDGAGEALAARPPATSCALATFEIVQPLARGGLATTARLTWSPARRALVGVRNCTATSAAIAVAA